MNNRLDWIDQARGLSIFLVVWGHNFPSVEPYIYSFHVPLFFLISGMFHPQTINRTVILKRTKSILIPYFFWSTLLFLFWLFIDRSLGKGNEVELNAFQNFIGIFYAQGGQEYMDWGIPLWFLPCIYIVFLLFSALQRIKNKGVLYVSIIAVITFGFLWFPLTEVHLPWSVDVAMVAISFYAFGYFFNNQVKNIKGTRQYVAMFVFFLIHITIFYFTTQKVDMYRSIYGTPMLFLTCALSGSLFYLMVFKTLPLFTFFSYIGKHTLLILATHLRALTFIKLLLFVIVGTTVFDFSELEKFFLAILQIVILIPVVFLINKFAPILDGKVKKTR